MTQVSLELYPSNAKGDERSLRAADNFVGQTSFVSVTCTKGDLAHTQRLCASLRTRGHQPAAHMICGGKTPAAIDKMIAAVTQQGITKVVALRGDQPATTASQSCTTAHFVRLLAEASVFDEICVGGYPDIHPDATTASADLQHLGTKVTAGATRIITQFCFNVATLCNFRDRLVTAGIQIPISVGLLPIRNFTKMIKFARRCRAVVPPAIQQQFDTTNVAGHKALAAKLLTDLTRDLVAEGFDIHYYTLNSVTIINEAWRNVMLASTTRVAAA